MHINPLEKLWLYVSIIMSMSMVAVITFYAVMQNTHPPSNVQTINSSRLHLDGEFTEDKIGVSKNADGSLTVRLIAARYGFYPPKVEVPANTKVTFRMASADVLHGVHVPFTNMATMVVPGYISEVTTQFPKPGEYSFLCNEYCGLGHHQMWSRLVVTPK